MSLQKGLLCVKTEAVKNNEPLVWNLLYRYMEHKYAYLGVYVHM